MLRKPDISSIYTSNDTVALHHVTYNCKLK